MKQLAFALAVVLLLGGCIPYPTYEDGYYSTTEYGYQPPTYYPPMVSYPIPFVFNFGIGDGRRGYGGEHGRSYGWGQGYGGWHGGHRR